MPRPLRTRRQPPADTVVVKPAATKNATPKPAKKTRPTATVEPSPAPEPSKKTRSKKQTKTAEPKPTRSTRQKPADTPSPTKQFSPLQSPSQSSDAENRMPGATVPSSPPLAQSTPKAARHDSLDFSSDAGYTPPSQSRKQQRAEGAVLKNLEPRTLRPLIDDEEEERLPSPTPKRERVRPLVDEDSGSPSKRTGTGFFVGDYSQEFTIYSDPKPPSQRTVREDEELTGTMRPPESDIPWPSSPSRKRGSSDAGMDSRDEAVVETPAKATRISKRRKAATPKTGKDATTVNTEMLRAVIPQRRRKTVETIEVATYEINSDEDELSRPAPRKTVAPKTKRKGKGKAPATTTATKKTPARKPRSSSTAPPAALTKEAWSRPLTASARKGVSRTYGRKSTGTEEAHDDQDEENEEDGESELTPVPTSSTGNETEELGDGVLHREDKKRLEQIKHKFEEVDQWSLDFEDVSVSSVSGDSQKR